MDERPWSSGAGRRGLEERREKNLGGWYDVERNRRTHHSIYIYKTITP
jgi:hypothetical protein